VSAVRKIKPQEGPQKEFLSTKADIAIYGGGAGGGKSYAALLDPLRYLHKRNVDAVIFRRTTKQITNPGGLWDDASNIYPLVGMHPRQSGFLDWKMPGGLTVKFAHMEHEHNKYDWQGSAIPIIIFDELTHFSRTQFFYMLSRNRSVTGVPGYVRATCNPDADSWVAKFISWWIDEETGFPIPERDGVLRWFIKDGDDMVWGDSKEDLAQHYPPEVVKYAKSVTFIRARVTDNKLLMEKNPEYLANLNALDRVERSRLLDGNWKIRAASGEYFTRSDFEIIDTLPADVIRSVRYWDRAATKPSKANPNPDWTVGVKMHVTRNGLYIIEHVERFRDGPLGNEKKIKNITSSDKVRVTVGIEQDPGQAGKVEAQNWTRTLAGYDVRLFPVHKDKVTRATPYAAQVQAGNVKLMEGSWNDTFINEHESFPPEDNPRKKKENPESVGKDDQVDAASGAFNFLTGENVGQAKPPDSDSSTITGFLDNTEQW
jgi:predicted phage terminase large subunit-like protein